MEHDALAGQLRGAEHGSRPGDVGAGVVLGEGETGEALADVQLVARVDVGQVVDQIGGGDDPGARDAARGFDLLHPEARRGLGGDDLGRAHHVVEMRRDEHGIEGELRAPGLAPAPDQGGRFLRVARLLRLDHEVALALIPKRAADRERG